MPNEMLLLLLLALPFAGAIAAGMFPGSGRNRESLFATAVALAAHVLAWIAYPDVSRGEVLRFDAPWVPQLGLAFTIRMDGFAWMFTLLATGIGALVLVYARYYMSAADPR